MLVSIEYFDINKWVLEISRIIVIKNNLDINYNLIVT